MGFLEELFLIGFLMGSLNAIFLMLVPREGRVEDVKDFLVHKFGWGPL